MSYYKILGLEKEPFSTCPDPSFFYESRSHTFALTRIMIELHLRRGLSVVIGDIGTGKTTLSRKLYQKLKEKNDVIFHMILDPVYESEKAFLQYLALQLKVGAIRESPLQLKEAIKKYLFSKGVNEKKTVVLLIDEAQKLSMASLEVLRVLLNYETNEYKLIQLVLLGQMELLPKLRQMQNFMDRISFKCILDPLDEREVGEMINSRLGFAGYSGDEIFTDDAVREIYCHTQGRLRPINMICHNAIKELVINGNKKVDGEVVKWIVKREERFWPAETADLNVVNCG